MDARRKTAGNRLDLFLSTAAAAGRADRREHGTYPQPVDRRDGAKTARRLTAFGAAHSKADADRFVTDVAIFHARSAAGSRSLHVELWNESRCVTEAPQMRLNTTFALAVVMLDIGFNALLIPICYHPAPRIVN